MNRLQLLNRKMMKLEKEASISEDEYATYGMLIEVHEALDRALTEAENLLQTKNTSVTWPFAHGQLGLGNEVRRGEAVMKAYAWASGQIGIDWEAPEGSLVFAEGSERDLRLAVEATARLSYDGNTWLVPGVPEADDAAAVDALLAYQREVQSRLP